MKKTGYEKTIRQYLEGYKDSYYFPEVPKSEDNPHFAKALMMLVNEGLTNKEVAKKLYLRFRRPTPDMV